MTSEGCPFSSAKDNRFSNLVVDQIAVLRCKTVARDLLVTNGLNIRGGEAGDIFVNTGNGNGEWIPLPEDFGAQGPEGPPGVPGAEGPPGPGASTTLAW